MKELTQDLTVEDLNNYLSNEPKAVILHLYGTHCPTCRRTQPLLDKVFASYPQDTFNVVEIDLQKHIDVAKQYGVMSIPALLFIKRSEVLECLDSAKFQEHKIRYAIEQFTDLRIG